jgi:hypothetical protein
MKYVLAVALWGLGTYFLTGYVFERGFEQGYGGGRASVVQTEEAVYKQCSAWWFEGSEPRALKEINKYCDRRVK